MIPYEDYVPHAPEEIGEQVSIDHTACPAGVDTRGRLYIKRVSEELVVAYCHNCADKGHYISGFSNVNSYRHKEGDDEAPKVPVAKGISFPSHIIWNPSTWPPNAIDWAHKYLNPTEVHQMGLAYDVRRRRVLIPFLCFDAFCGFQTRRVEPDDPLPKYLSSLDFATKNRNKFYVPWVESGRRNQAEDKVVVVCEDMISAYKIYRQGFSPYCLCGSHFNIDEFYRDQQKVVPGMKGVLVWLDNDNSEIRELAERITQVLKLTYTGGDIIINRTSVPEEPKIYSMTFPDLSIAEYMELPANV